MGLFKRRLLGPFESMPYTNFHDLNLDWVLQLCKFTEETLKELPDAIDSEIDEALNKYSTDLAEQLRDYILKAPQPVNVMLLPDDTLPKFDNTGSTDNSAAMTTLLTWMQNNGRHVIMFPAGTYLMGSVQLPSNIAIIGESRYTSIIKANRYLVAPLFTLSTLNNYMGNIGLDLNAAQQATPITAIEVQGGNILLDNIYIKASGYGIYTNPTRQVQLSNIEMVDCNNAPALVVKGTNLQAVNISMRGSNVAMTTDGSNHNVLLNINCDDMQPAKIGSTDSIYLFTSDNYQIDNTANTVIATSTHHTYAQTIQRVADNMTDAANNKTTTVETGDQYTNNGGLEIDVHGSTTASMEHVHATMAATEFESNDTSGSTLKYKGPLTVAPADDATDTSINMLAGDTVDVGAGREITESVNGTHVVLSDDKVETNAQQIVVAKAKTVLTENFDALEITTLDATGATQQKQHVLLQGATWPPTMGGGGGTGETIIVEAFPEFDATPTTYPNIGTSSTVGFTNYDGALTVSKSKDGRYYQISLIVMGKVSTNTNTFTCIVQLPPPIQVKDGQKIIGDLISAVSVASRANGSVVANTINNALAITATTSTNLGTNDYLTMQIYGIVINADAVFPEGGTATDPNAVHITGGTMTGPLTMSDANINMQGTGKITGVITPTTDTDAASKKYVDDAVAGAGVPQELLDRVTTLESDNTTNMSEIADLQTSQGTQDTKIANLTTTQGAHTTLINNLQTTQQEHTTSITNLTRTQTQQDEKIADNAKTAGDAATAASSAQNTADALSHEVTIARQEIRDVDDRVTQLEASSGGGGYPIFNNVVLEHETMQISSSSGGSIHVGLSAVTDATFKWAQLSFNITVFSPTNTTIAAQIKQFGTPPFTIDVSKGIAETFGTCIIFNTDNPSMDSNIATSVLVGTTNTPGTYAILIKGMPAGDSKELYATATLIVPLKS